MPWCRMQCTRGVRFPSDCLEETHRRQPATQLASRVPVTDAIYACNVTRDPAASVAVPDLQAGLYVAVVVLGEDGCGGCGELRI